MKSVSRSIGLVFGFLLVLPVAVAQRTSHQSAWESTWMTPSVSGYESYFLKQIAAEIKAYSPQTDNLGNLYVTIGSGAPHRLIVAPVDQPGYVVSGITDDGYLRVQRLPQRPPNAIFDSLYFAQPVMVHTLANKEIAGVFAGLSIHLRPQRQNAPKMSHPDDLYIDIGAKSAKEVRAAGVDLLDPVILDPFAGELGGGNSIGLGIGDRFGARVLVELLTSLGSEKQNIQGTLTVAFVTQSWTGGRGFERILRETSPDEVIYVSRLNPAKPDASKATPDAPGEGVLLGVKSSSLEKPGLATELKELADRNRIAAKLEPAELPRIGGYVATTSLPDRFVVAGLATNFPATPAETLNHSDAAKIAELLHIYLVGKAISPERDSGYANSRVSRSLPLLGILSEVYGASGHESAVREAVTKQLPDWAQKKLTTDSAGNLILHLGDRQPERSVAFVAHMDELGYEVKSIEADGRLRVEELGGSIPQYFLGHPVLVHTKSAGDHGGVLELPEGYNKPDFDWQAYEKLEAPVLYVNVGTASKSETEALGIAMNDFITIPKQYRPMIAARANVRSFDDRVGCTALIQAARELGPLFIGRDITFVWSTEEEVGLKGAAVFAENAAKEGRTPQFVFAIDTFVSSDSPLESKRFADAKLGAGFVVRAVDNSNIAPSSYVQRVIALAQSSGIPVQYGVTGGGNDGSVFQRYGSIDIPLGWPLRYAHSPGEVIDTKDLDALSKIIAVLARRW